MARDLKDDIETYIGHFRLEHAKLLRLGDRLHQKILVVTMLGALAEGRYPTTRGDRAKFVRLIEECADWPDATSVSLPMLDKRIKTDRPPGLSEPFVSGLWSRYARWHRGRSYGDMPPLRRDPRPEDILPALPNKDEVCLVERYRHSRLLYRYRSKLVHEFREPGYGFEFDQRDKYPYYHSMTDLADDTEKMELVYPAGWFLNLIPPILVHLESYYIRSGTNPYASYRFGSPW